jgi:hypothetical protein
MQPLLSVSCAIEGKCRMLPPVLKRSRSWWSWSSVQAVLESQKQKDTFHVSLDLGNLVPSVQQGDNLPKGRLHALLPACRYMVKASAPLVSMINMPWMLYMTPVIS